MALCTFYYSSCNSTAGTGIAARWWKMVYWKSLTTSSYQGDVGDVTVFTEPLLPQRVFLHLPPHKASNHLKSTSCFRRDPEFRMVQIQNFALVQGGDTLFRSDFHCSTWPSWSLRLLYFLALFSILFYLYFSLLYRYPFYYLFHFYFLSNRILTDEQKALCSCQIYFGMIDFGQRF